MKPIVLLPCDNRMIGGHPMQVLGQKYSDAVRDQAACLPIPFPCTGHEDIDAYLALADGVLLTGSPSNVHPSNFGQGVHDGSLPLDPKRDQITLPLIRRVIELGIPMLAICRGLQELNVALGGTLYQAVQEIDGRTDHRGAHGKPDATKEETYALAHPISVLANGCLAGIIGGADVMVNSVHGQGVNQLASNLRVEATAPDGQIEAVSIKNHSGFSLALQWHPEWRAWENETSKQIFSAFGAACAQWQQKNVGVRDKELSRAA
jgi:putative glutamine amidotransferase